MYEWLTDALSESSTVVTANRRLARTLREEYGAAQIAAGLRAWRSPTILPWQHWLDELVANAASQDSIPTRINTHQSQFLWERCLRQVIDEPGSSIANLVKLSRIAWQQLADWQISVSEVARSAQTIDQRMFASAAGRYHALLQRDEWVDEAGVGGLVLKLMRSGDIRLHDRYLFVGFDRQKPIAKSILAAIEDKGSEARSIEPASRAESTTLHKSDSADAELRSAGVWARRKIEDNPDARVAIVVQGLEQSADRVSRLFKEGFVPGWQYGPGTLADAVNVSYGRKLTEFPAVAIALRALDWLAHDLTATDIGLLLRTPLLGDGDTAGRARMELALRRLPDRRWSPSMLTSAFRGAGDGPDWLSRVAALTKLRRTLPQKTTSAQWAVLFDESLIMFGWPGKGVLESADFQLLNRWRELLNEFARMDLVSGNITLRTALSRLAQIADATLFQPEASRPVVSLIGPLEAAGAEFDALWVGGLMAAAWPPAAAPSRLISRALQQRHDLPDATPADTAKYAQRRLARLAGSATEVVCSYALTVDDTEQAATEFLETLRITKVQAIADPGWNANRFLDLGGPLDIPDDVPRVTTGEKISGGAGTLQLQLAEPISAFIFGRLGVQTLGVQATGVPAHLRGNIIHDALQKLYLEKPSRSVICGWSSEELSRRIDESIEHAFGGHERSADRVLLQLLKLERIRVDRLLRRFVGLDSDRHEFQIDGIERQLEFAYGALHLTMRADRIDRFEDGEIAILDYKTGAPKKLMRRRDEANEIQLFAYARAIEDPVAALALVNIDSRNITFDGVGREFGNDSDWQDQYLAVQMRIEQACRELEAGDVRVNVEQGAKDARPVNLLSRYAELRNGR